MGKQSEGSKRVRGRDAKRQKAAQKSEAQKVIRTKEVTMEAIALLLEDLAENSSTDIHSEWFFAAADLVRKCILELVEANQDQEAIQSLLSMQHEIAMLSLKDVVEKF
jgi:hypothetical protein